jgi:hypothetical protein
MVDAGHHEQWPQPVRAISTISGPRSSLRDTRDVRSELFLRIVILIGLTEEACSSGHNEQEKRDESDRRKQGLEVLCRVVVHPETIRHAQPIRQAEAQNECEHHCPSEDTAGVLR